MYTHEYRLVQFRILLSGPAQDLSLFILQFTCTKFTNTYKYIPVHVSFIVGTQRCDILTMRMATIEKLGEFRTDVEDWSQYSVRMEFYFVANGVTGDAKKKAAFLSAIGPSTYKLLQSLIAPTTVQDADVHVADLITALQNHFEPQPSVIVQRAKFYSHSREREDRQ